MNRWGLAAVLAAVASLLGLLWTTPLVSTLLGDALLLVQLGFGYAFLLSTSGFVVAGALRFAGTRAMEEEVDTGRAVGKIENVLVLTLTLLGAYTALAIVFTAKSIVRWEDLTSENTTYYLTGSIANATYSLLVGLLLLWMLDVPPA